MEIIRQGWLASRRLMRAPGFALTAALTLALGIGLSTAVFAVANGILLRRLPVRDQDRVVVLWGETRDGRFSNLPLALDDIRQFEQSSRSLDGVAFFAFRGATPSPIRTGDRVFPILIALVSGNFFDVLQTRPAIGRALRPDDDIAGAAPVVVLSHSAWQRHFGGDSTVIGKPITMVYTGHQYTIAGVMPKGLDYPRGVDIWAPIIAYSSAGGFRDIVTRELDMLARLTPDASSEQVRAELSEFLARPGAPAWYRDARGVVHSFPDIVLGDTKASVIFVSLAAALLLFITCINVANLLLVRALGRVRELMVRVALGASRRRVVGELLTESAVLSLVGGVLGVGLAFAVVRAFIAIVPEAVPRVGEIGVNGTAFLAALVVTGAALLISGLGPAIVTSRVNADDALRSGARSTNSGRVRTIGQLLVIAQMALAAVSLTTAGLITRSLVRLQNVELAFEPRQLLVANLAMGNNQIVGPARQRETLDQILSKVQALPGVIAASPVMSVPFVGAGGGIDGRLSAPGQGPTESASNPMLNLEAVAPNYFGVLEIPVLRGRTFGDQDREGAGLVTVISASVAQHFWPNADPIGKTLVGGGNEYTVVGVVPDTRYRELKTARPTVYLPLAQLPFGGMLPSTMLIRTAIAPSDVIPALRRAISEVNPGVAIVSASSLQTLLDAPRAEPRLNAIVLALFAVTAVSLAAIGLFAVIATLVRQRRHEIGIRMALGATAGDVRRMVLVRGLSLAGIGVAIGLLGALATSRMLSSLLFEVSPTDTSTLVSVVLVMLFVAVLACILPARASSNVDPVIALRSET